MDFASLFTTPQPSPSSNPYICEELCHCHNGIPAGADLVAKFPAHIATIIALTEHEPESVERLMRHAQKAKLVFQYERLKLAAQRLEGEQS